MEQVCRACFYLTNLHISSTPESSHCVQHAENTVFEVHRIFLLTPGHHSCIRPFLGPLLPVLALALTVIPKYNHGGGEE